MWYPIDTETAQLLDGVWRVDFPVNNNARVLQWISLVGPGGSVKVYLGTVFMDTTEKGNFNRADYYKGIPIAAGQMLSVIWDNGLGVVPPTVSIGCTDGDSELTGSLFTVGR
jgi:hypothetical protein